MIQGFMTRVFSIYDWSNKSLPYLYNDKNKDSYEEEPSLCRLFVNNFYDH
jgi:hypothetical protein